ncbi:MAG TPA: hypothetical protein VFF27_09765, partial [Bacteroidia bacterium]|nr:hypothetical protein [Bacteroidia bacterium]
MRFYLFVLLMFTGIFISNAQQPATNQYNGSPYKINWRSPLSSKISETETINLLNFSGAQHLFADGFLPRYYQQVTIDGGESSIAVKLVNPIYENLSDAEATLIKSAAQIPTEIKVQASIYIVKKEKKGVVSFIPIRKNAQTGKLEKLVAFDLQTTPNYSKSLVARPVNDTASSVLASGKWYRIAVAKDGVYKISYAFLKGLGIDVDAIDPHKIAIYGNGGGMLPKLNSDPRPYDLTENAILVEGETDNKFNTDDYVLFYGQGPNRWKYNASGIPAFKHIMHLFSDSTYYFINVDLKNGNRIKPRASSSATPTVLVNTFDDYAFHENDNQNLINSGNQWFGEFFDNISSYDFSFNFPFI